MAPQTSHLPLAGKTALVTGGSRGIGAGIAFELAKRSADFCPSFLLLSPFISFIPSPITSTCPLPDISTNTLLQLAKISQVIITYRTTSTSSRDLYQKIVSLPHHPRMFSIAGDLSKPEYPALIILIISTVKHGSRKDASQRYTS